MPVKHDIGNIYESREDCIMCGGTGLIATYVGTITCPNCRDWARDAYGQLLTDPRGHALRSSTGEIPSFRTELMQTTHSPLPSQRHYADAATPAPPQVVNRRPVNTGRAARRR